MVLTTHPLKLADVAIAVHNATDVAKDSADIVLLEDDLGVILDGIQYGRSIFVNINKYIKHAMIGNLGNFFSMIFFYIFFCCGYTDAGNTAFNWKYYSGYAFNDRVF